MDKLIDGKKVNVKFLHKNRKLDNAKFIQCQVTYNRETTRFKIPIGSYYYCSDKTSFEFPLDEGLKAYEEWIITLMRVYSRNNKINVKGLNQIVKKNYLPVHFVLGDVAVNGTMEILGDVLTHNQYIFIEDFIPFRDNDSLEWSSILILNFPIKILYLVKTMNIPLSVLTQHEYSELLTAFLHFSHYDFIKSYNKTPYFTGNEGRSGIINIGSWSEIKEEKNSFKKFLYSKISTPKTYNYSENINELFTFIDINFPFTEKDIEDIMINIDNMLKVAQKSFDYFAD